MWKIYVFGNNIRGRIEFYEIISFKYSFSLFNVKIHKKFKKEIFIEIILRKI